MGDFLFKVRNGMVKAPQQRGFSISAWQKSFGEIPAPDGDDHELLASGLCFAAEFQVARDLTAKYSKELQQPQSLLAFLGLATLQWALVNEQTAQAFQENTDKGRFISEQTAEIRISNSMDVPFDPVAVIESLVDGARFPLSFLSPQSSTESSGEHQLQALEMMFKLGPYYHTLEHYWLECVWNDYVTTCDDTTLWIKPKASGTQKIQAISRFRQATRRLEHVQRAKAQWISGPSDEFKRSVLRQKVFLTSRKRNGKTRLQLRPATEIQDNPPPSFFNRVLLTHHYLESINEEPRKEFSGLSITNILDTYELLSHLPSQIYKHLPGRRNIANVEEAERYAPRMDRAELERVFSVALKVSNHQAAWLVDFLSFKMTVRDELWFRPLVKLPGSEISLVVAAVDGLNFTRANDYLLGELSKPEEELGARFEQHVRTRLKESTANFKFRNCFNMMSEGCNFEIASGEQEQIDLVYSLGNKFFVGEIKAIISPASPLEVFNYIDRLTTEGAGQAKRKADFVASHLAEFLQSINLSQNLDIPSITVCPVVITNDFFMAGSELMGVPITDLAILTRYFEYGYLGKVAYADPSGELIATSRHEFYRTENEAVGNHESYLRNPPQTSVYGQHATLDDIDYKVPFSRRSSYRIQEYQIHYPYDELRSQLDATLSRRTGKAE